MSKTIYKVLIVNINNNMNIKEIKDLDSCAAYINDLLNDLLSGKISKGEAMALLGKYTAHIVDHGYLLKK